MRNSISYLEFEERIGEDVVKKILLAFHEGFQDSVQQIKNGNQLGVLVEYEPRTRANLAHDHIKARLKSYLGGNNDIEINKWKGIFALKFGDDAFCRVKKFINGSVAVSVTLTIQQQRWNNQLTINGFPDDPALITIGYYADKPWTTLLGVYAACYNADGLLWFQKLGGEGFSQLSLFETPKVPVAPKPVERPKRVTGKKTPKKNTGTDSNNV